MKTFFKTLLAVVVGTILTSLLFILIFFVFVGALVSSSENDVVTIEPNSVLHLTFASPVVDRASDDPFENINFMNLKSESKIGLCQLFDNLKKAKEDKNIKGIYLDLSSVEAGTASLQEIRDALLDFKTSKKFIVSYGDSYTQGAYYLASVADSIFLNPVGAMEFKGLSANVVFLKNMMEKIGVEPQVFRHGKFKSAVEPFLLDKMSEANREQTKTYIGAIWNQIVKDISKARNIDVATLNKIADTVVMFDAERAMRHKLIDGLRYRDEVTSMLKKRAGIGQKDELSLVALNKYEKVPVTSQKVPKEKIAIVYASGDVVMGNDDKNLSADGVSKALRKARLDEKVKAIVFRINSPGGDALAADIILREVKLAVKVKPVIVSMGDVAASGGYYVACAADTIVADANTITGSIGVFGLMMNASKLFNDKLGITFDGYKTNDNSDIGATNRKVTPVEEFIIQRNVESWYNTFITHVSDGRNMAKQQVDAIGQGRVWAGSSALDIKLVDVLGGMQTAIKIAAEKAKLKEYRIINLPEEKDAVTKLLESLTGEQQTKMLKKELGQTYEYYHYLKQMSKAQSVQARLPFFLEIN
jgi:protease IV